MSHPFVCEVCGTTGISKRKRRFCSALCKGRFHGPANRARVRAWYYANRERALEGCRRRRARLTSDERRAMSVRARPGRSRSHLRRVYGLTPEDIQTISNRQGGVCAICRRPETALNSKGAPRTRLNVDHDHITGQNRGLLCVRCNMGLGSFADDPALLRAAANYLAAWQVERTA